MKKNTEQKVQWGDPPEVRFPKRLEKVRQLGTEIAMTEGVFSPPSGDGRLKRAIIGDFEISFRTPFNGPRRWRGIDWQDKRLRHKLYGLLVRLPGQKCLEVFWTDDDIYVRFFRDPRIDGWDRALRHVWEERCARAARSIPAPRRP